MKHFEPEIARLALRRWNADPKSLKHLGTSGNDVYQFRDGEAVRVLRLTDTSYRSLQTNLAEMHFLLHLARRGVQVNEPIPSTTGALVEDVPGGSACALSWAPGVLVTSGSQFWDEEFFREWGRCLGRIHAAAQDYEGPARWDWWQEGFLTEAEQLIPGWDVESRAELREVLRGLHDLPRNRRNYGMIHADFGPQNFNYEPYRGLTAFDFGNCCHHWYVVDLAISLSVLRREKNRDELRGWLLEGYREECEIDPEIWKHLDLFLRLRIVYVYLSRLKMFGGSPSAEQAKTLELLRSRVLERVEWK
jgi:Ser/Thr protein kinase RdoA (MazF antagonist)